MGLGKTGLNREVVLISSGLNSNILLFFNNFVSFFFVNLKYQQVNLQLKYH